MAQKSAQRKTRRRSREIRLVQSTAPWMQVGAAAAESGVRQKEIRANLPLRRFGNSDYVAPASLNQWILTGHALARVESPSPNQEGDQDEK
jgi:hypothetical protein